MWADTKRNGEGVDGTRASTGAGMRDQDRNSQHAIGGDNNN